MDSAVVALDRAVGELCGYPGTPREVAGHLTAVRVGELLPSITRTIERLQRVEGRRRGVLRFDGFYEHKLSAWDSAAGFLIVEEAGGKVTDMKGNYYNPYQPGIIATNGIIHQELLDVVKGGDV